MFMFGSTVEKLEEKDKKIEELNDELHEVVKENMELISKVKFLEDEKARVGERHAFEIDKAKHELAKTMEQKLIESDLKRVEAVAKYNAYAEMDTKDERLHIQKMLEKAIDSLGKATQIVVAGQK